MSSNEIVVVSELPVEDCWKRVTAAQEDAPGLVGQELASQLELVANGDEFDLRHKVEPAVFTGSIADSGRGSAISGRLGVPCRALYCGALIFALTVGGAVIGASAYDLFYGTQHLLTRNTGEGGIGHPATRAQHFQVFILVPLLLLAVIVALWPKVRPVSAETRQTTEEYLRALFKAGVPAPKP